MRRALSILLTLFFAIGPLTPLFGETDDPRLPACCRRHGSHHCAMYEAALAQAISSSGQPAWTAQSHCPLYPHGTLAPSSSAHALIAANVQTRTLLTGSHRLGERHVAPASRFFPNLSVRGPPAPSFA